MKTWGDFLTWKHLLRGRGVEIVEWRSTGELILYCQRCHIRWSPKLGTGPDLPDNYWLCPNRCNAQEATR